jgi:hypothetical protein
VLSDNTGETSRVKKDNSLFNYAFSGTGTCGAKTTGGGEKSHNTHLGSLLLACDTADPLLYKW